MLSEAVMKTVIKYARKAMDELCIIGHDGTPRLARFAREVFGVEEADNRKAAELGIQKVRAFNQSLEMPQLFLRRAYRRIYLMKWHQKQ